MKSENEIKNNLKSLSVVLSKIHKSILENEMSKIEKSQGVILTPAAKIQILLNDPQLAWLRPMSQFMAAVDGICFQKEPLQPQQIQDIINSYEQLFSKPDTSDFSKKYFGQFAVLTDLMIEHGHLKVALRTLSQSI